MGLGLTWTLCHVPVPWTLSEDLNLSLVIEFDSTCVKIQIQPKWKTWGVVLKCIETAAMCFSGSNWYCNYTSIEYSRSLPEQRQCLFLSRTWTTHVRQTGRMSVGCQMWITEMTGVIVNQIMQQDNKKRCVGWIQRLYKSSNLHVISFIVWPPSFFKEVKHTHTHITTLSLCVCVCVCVERPQVLLRASYRRVRSSFRVWQISAIWHEWEWGC